MDERFIREFSGKIIGMIKTDANGNKTARTFPSRRVVGTYDAKSDCTKDFYGRIVARGDDLAALITSNREF